MKAPRFTKLVSSLPSTVPFVGPETQERARGKKFAARLGANENVFGPSRKAIAAMQAAVPDVWMYGDPENRDLKLALAAFHGVKPENIVVGAGIDGLLGSLARMLVTNGTPVVITKLAYTAKWQKKSDNGGLESVAAEYDIAYFDVFEYIKASGYKPAQLRVSKWDSHPNAIAHRQIAEAVQENLVNLQLLPVTAETAAPKSAN